MALQAAGPSDSRKNAGLGDSKDVRAEEQGDEGAEEDMLEEEDPAPAKEKGKGKAKAKPKTRGKAKSKDKEAEAAEKESDGKAQAEGTSTASGSKSGRNFVWSSLKLVPKVRVKSTPWPADGPAELETCDMDGDLPEEDAKAKREKETFKLEIVKPPLALLTDRYWYPGRVADGKGKGKSVGESTWANAKVDYSTNGCVIVTKQ